MEKREINPELRKKVQKQHTFIMLGMMAVILLYIVYALLTKHLTIGVFQVMLTIFILVYTILSDVAEPYRLGMFQNLTIGQRDALTKMFILDVVGVGCLIYWIIGMSDPDAEASILPVMFYVLFMQMKRKQRPAFEGTEEEEQTEENTEAAEIEEVAAEETEEETEA